MSGAGGIERLVLRVANETPLSAPYSGNKGTMSKARPGIVPPRSLLLRAAARAL
jgi:hypothetical protein